MLGAHHEHISKAFSSKLTPEERFKHGAWIELETGSPVLDDALVSFDCEIEQIQQVGTHTILYVRLWRLNKANMTKVWFILTVLITKWGRQRLSNLTFLLLFQIKS